MKKFFRHITKVIIFSFVICLFLPLKQIDAAIISQTSIAKTNVKEISGKYYYTQYYSVDYPDSVDLCICSFKVPSYSSSTGDYLGDAKRYCLVASDTTNSISVKRQEFVGDNPSSFKGGGLINNAYGNPNYVTNDKGQRCYYTLFESIGPNDDYNLFLELPYLEFASDVDFVEFVKKVDISDDIPPVINTDTYSLDKSVGLVQNARWKHLESKDKYNEVLQNAVNSGTGTGDPGNANYSDIYTHYAEFVQDKCSFATTSTTGIKIGGRYQLQYASRVGFTFAYNLPNLLEGIDNTKQYYKRFGSSKPYPIVDGTNFDANQNIQSLFVQAYQWNDTLPSIGTWKRSLIFKETKYWIDVRIIDTKNKTYGAWYAMDMKTNSAKEVVTGDGDIDSDVSSEDNAHDYTKEEGEGDTFKDAEDNAKEVDKSTHYDQKWYDDIKDNTKKSAPAFKTLLNMITGIPKMIATLFSWLPSWVLQLVSAFFALVIVLALLRFVLGS